MHAKNYSPLTLLPVTFASSRRARQFPHAEAYLVIIIIILLTPLSRRLSLSRELLSSLAYESGLAGDASCYRRRL